MCHPYSLPVRVWPYRSGSHAGEPSSFRWRGQVYRVVDVYARWHLMDRWWEARNPYAGKGAADRQYWRVECQPFGLQCELYYDHMQNVWVLDRLLD